MVVDKWSEESQMQLKLVLENAMEEVKPDFCVAVVGGRDFTNQAKVIHVLDKLFAEKKETHNIVILNGNAKGADNCGRMYGLSKGYTVRTFEAQWNNLEAQGAVVKEGKYGPYNAKAGHDRNALMRHAAHAVVAFWDGQSRGTGEMVSQSKKIGLPVRIIHY